MHTLLQVSFANKVNLIGTLGHEKRKLVLHLQKQAFDQVKELLSSAPLLTHYNTEKLLILVCDASLYGVGAVLSHCLDDHSERPNAYASCMLKPAECRYAQLDKEALGFIFGVKYLSISTCMVTSS